MAAALEQWRQLLGEEHVVTDSEDRRRFESATFTTHQKIPVILRPSNSVEVQGCLRIAAVHGIPLYPSSRGCNWGLGSRVPVRDSCGALDLIRMDQILDFSEDMATITIEPGVTFQQVVDFLDERRSQLFFNITGSSPWSSPVGNALERGDGVGPYGDRIAHTCGLEVVLPDGRIVHTGMSRFENAATATLHRWGVGPSMDGLFAQSSLGVVTKMTFWLKPKPAVLQIVRFRIDDRSRLSPLVDVIRRLRLEGTLRSGAGLWNDFRAFSARGGFPWDRHEAPLRREQLRTMMPDDGAWYGLTTLYSAHIKQAEGNLVRLEEALLPVTDLLAVASKKLGEDVEDTMIKGEPSMLAPFGDVTAAFGLMGGRPSVASQRSMYWRKRHAESPDFQTPERDNCGVVWVCPLVPLEGSQAIRASDLVEKIISDHGLEPLLGWVIQHERVAYLIALLIYDRDVPGEDERAMACHDAVLQACVAQGWIPWRLGVHSMESLPGGRGDTDDVLREIKRVLDPQGILAPGRYV